MTNSIAFDAQSMANATIENLTLEMTKDGILQRVGAPSGAVKELAKSGIVYRYKAGQETFYSKDQAQEVSRFDTTALSQFSVPTFGDLREALQRYAVESIRESTCYLFDEAWNDANRLFFASGPEWRMRRSLTQYLRNRMSGDYDVLPEQNVDESHPVDIRVTPKLSNTRLALIEIKWLGDSIGEDGGIVPHRDARARAGATQLVGYIENQRQSSPSHTIHAYYVVIDGRRRGLKKDTVTLSQSDGLYYENREIDFGDESYSDRTDFDPPYRMFARPKNLT